MKKKIVVLASVFMLSTSTGCEAAATTAQSSPTVDKIKAAVINFSDILQHWAMEAILKAVQKGYVDGYEDGTFKTDQNVSRAEFIKMIVTACGDYLGSTIYGFINDRSAMLEGKLVGLARVSLKIPGDTPAFLIPKNNYKTDGDIEIRLNTPARPPLPIVYKRVLYLKTSK